MTEASAMSMFAALLDLSFVQVGESVADGRFLTGRRLPRSRTSGTTTPTPLFGVILCRPGSSRRGPRGISDSGEVFA